MEHGPFEYAFPIENGDLPPSYVSLPEGFFFKKSSNNSRYVRKLPGYQVMKNPGELEILPPLRLEGFGSFFHPRNVTELPGG